MKILHIGKYFAPFSGGVENYQRDAMIALAGRGIQSAALVHRHEPSLTGSEEILQAHGLDLPVSKAATWAKLLFTPISPGFPWRLSRLIKSFKPDILHLHMPNPSAFWALFLISARRIPWVVHWHADVITDQHDWKMKFFYQIYRHFERAVLKRSAAIIATSPPYLASSQPLQAWMEKCRIVPLGVDASRLLDEGAPAGIQLSAVVRSQAEGRQAQPSPQAKEHAVDPPLRVLAIGRLTYYKGFRYLIEATALFSDMQVHIVGTGDQESELKALVASLNLGQRVIFHGVLDNRQLAAQMTLCDCICLPSIERTEAFGMVLLEAQSFGKATVVSDVPGSGMGWVVEHNETGLKVPPADAAALADALRSLQNNRGKLVTMGRNGRRKFAREFAINKAVDGLIRVYQQVLEA